MIYENYTKKFYVKGKKRGIENYGNKVKMNCDNCKNDFYGILRSYIDKKYHRCKKCHAIVNGQKQCRNKGMKQNNSTHIRYWIDKGYSEEEARIKIRAKRVTCKEYWTNKGYSEEEAQNISSYEAKLRTKISTLYWTNKGYSEEEAQNKKKEYIKKYNVYGDFSRDQNRLCVEFWVKRGFDKIESKEKILEEQHKMHNVRDNEKLAASLRKFYQDETEESRIKRISKAKLNGKKLDKARSPIFKEYWMKRGFSINESRCKILSIKHNGTSASNIENNFFKAFENFSGIEFERNKYLVMEGNIIIPDGIYKNLIIEFNGTNVHLDPRFKKEFNTNPWGRSYKDVRDRDNLKKELYLQNYNFLVVWEYDYNNNKNLFSKIEEIVNEGCKKGKYWDSSCL